MTHSHIASRIAALAACACIVTALFAADSEGAAIFTSLSDGTTVNQNLYASKSDVYLNGGPQNQNASGLVNGFYYFQVTDPSGSVLLSTDSILNRALTVSNGVVSGITGSGGTHAIGTFNPNNLSTPVQLFPFNHTPNQGGEYKVWLTTVADYDPQAHNSAFGFVNSRSKTDNFKVRNGVEIATPVPEPATLILTGLGLAGVLGRRRKKG